jgi:hypothetical protein
MAGEDHHCFRERRICLSHRKILWQKIVGNNTIRNSGAFRNPLTSYIDIASRNRRSPAKLKTLLASGKREGEVVRLNEDCAS